MTARGYTVFVCNQSLRPTKLRNYVGNENEINAAGKVTVGLASHRPYATDFVICLYVLVGLKDGYKHPAYVIIRIMAPFKKGSPYSITERRVRS